MRCFAFCPAVVASASFHRALSTTPCEQLRITTVVVSHDIVPRLSHDSIVQFVQQMASSKVKRFIDPMQVVGSTVLYCHQADGEFVVHNVPHGKGENMNLLRAIHIRRPCVVRLLCWVCLQETIISKNMLTCTPGNYGL